MVSYLKLEIFAYDLFHSVWLKGGLISRKYDATEIYKDECLSDNVYMEVCDKVLYDAVLCRRILFQSIYREEIIKERDRYWNSTSDFYNFIRSACDRYDCFGRLTVFERLLATCAFVLNLCFYNSKNENVDIIQFGHACWAIYFDDFTEEFYDQGGWSQLKNVASSYTLPLMCLQMFMNEPENVFTEVAEAVESYNNLNQTSIIHECETVSKLWIKSRIKSLPSSNNNTVEFKGDEKYLHAERILNELKCLCNPCDLEVLEYDEECSERFVFDSDSFYIPLTPITSEESMVRTKSLSVSSDEIEGDALLASSPEIYSKSETDDSDFINNSCFNELEDLISCQHCDDTENDSIDILEQSVEFESICLISDCERDQFLSRSMTKLHLNHDTLELEETTISETDISIITNNESSEEDQILNTTDEIQLPQEILNKQCQTLDDSLDAVNLVSNDALAKVSVTEGHNTCFKDEELEYVSSFPNNFLRYHNQLSISEWDEKDLVKNISTPIKPKETLNKDLLNIQK